MLIVPLGALVVVTFRLTLGLRLLGPFRSILLALGFVATGIVTGLIFVAATIGALLAAPTVVSSLRLPYFGRVSVMLSAVAILLVIGAIAGTWAGSASVADTARFPIIVLCLIAEAVARTIRKEGARAGVSRLAATSLVAVVVTALASTDALRVTLERRPELLLAEAALIVVVARFCAWRLLQRPGLRALAPRRAFGAVRRPPMSSAKS